VRFSVEAAVARAPQGIVLADHSSGASTAGRAAPEKWQAPPSVPAVRARPLSSPRPSLPHPRRPPLPAALPRLRPMVAPPPARGAVGGSGARRLAVALAALTSALFGIALAALFIGSAGLSPSAVARALTGRAEPASVEAIVTLSLRLPRVAVAMLAGAALAVA